MEIIVGKNSGFCGGVRHTIDQANKLLDEDSIYCLGEIVHNNQVIENLENKGMITVESIDEVPSNSKVIFRAHGEPPIIYKKAEERNIQIEDLTCGVVKSIHQKVESAKEDSFIIIVGNKSHPETIGTKGFAGSNSYVIEDEDDILDSYMEYEKTNLGKVFVVAQTTFSSKKFDKLADEIEKNFWEAEVKIDKTICNSTENRQLEAEVMSKKCDVMIIIGGKHSSNTKKLFEIAERNCEKSYLIQTVDDLKNMKFASSDKIGIMAGASTPDYLIDEVKNYLEGIN